MRKLRHDEIVRVREQSRPAQPHPVRALLEDVRSAYNVGAMFRAADAAGIEKLHLAGITATPDNRRIHKTALGSETMVPWDYRSAAIDTVAELKSAGFGIVVLEITTRPTPIESFTLADFPMCLVIGNEVEGVSSELVELADHAIEIEQFGRKQSLNAAVAFGVTVLDLVRRYRALAQLDDGEASLPSNDTHHARH